MAFRRQPVESDRRFNRLSPKADHGTRERWQHSGRMLELTERAGVLAARVLEESVVDILILCRWITQSQHEAAVRFKKDYHLAKMEARLTGSYNPARTMFSHFGPWDERSEAEEAAYQRWRHALRAVGMIHSDLIITVVCHDKMPRQQRAPDVREGLQKLVRWYGLPERRLGEDVDQAAAW